MWQGEPPCAHSLKHHPHAHVFNKPPQTRYFSTRRCFRGAGNSADNLTRVRSCPVAGFYNDSAEENTQGSKK